jgi:DNA-binding CsgD family transcriptional regulator/tetratricopeptide (TPR) repeat protein
MTSVTQTQDNSQPTVKPIVASRNAFIGRAYELDRLEAWLQEPTRLITITGPAGVGKSRLVLELLPSLTSFDVVCLDAAQLGAGFIGHLEQHLTQAVCGSSQKPRLLILDHLGWHDPVFAQSLQDALAKSNLRLLTVSQGSLHMPDERRFELEPLSTLAVEGPSAAAKLFAILSGLNPNDPVVQKLCETLGGLPLALEVASAQLSFLSPSELLEHATALLNLPNPYPNAPHHTTLLQAMERNLVGLNELERLALACLNECRGPVQAQSLIAMLEQPAMMVLPLMHKLCELHLVNREIQADGTSGFGLPAMMRLYHQAPVQTSGLAARQASELRQRHAMYFTELALQELQPSVYQPEQQRAIAVLGLHRNDLEHARQHWIAADDGDAFAAQQLVRLSIGYAHAIAIESGSEERALEILNDALEVLPCLPDGPRFHLLHQASLQAMRQEDFVRAERLAQHSRTVALEANNLDWIVLSNNHTARMLEILEQFEACERLLQDSLQRLQDHPEHPAKATALNMLAWRSLTAGDAPESIRLMQESRSIFERHNQGFEIARVLCGLACAHLHLHETNLALTFLNESRRVQRESGGQDESDLLEVFARCELNLGHYSAAWSHLRSAIEDVHARGQWNRVMLCLTGFSQILICSQHLEQAARLYGHIEFLRCRHMLQATNHCKAHLHQIETSLSELEPTRLNELQRQGMTWTHTLEVIVAFEQHPDLQAIFGCQTNPAGASLSKRQLEVMNLIRAGLTNKRIAQQLGLTERTVKFHITEAFNKLGVSNRVQALRALEATQEQPEFKGA